MAGKMLAVGGRTDSVQVVSGAITDTASYAAAGSDAGFTTQSGVAAIPLYDPASAPLLVPYAVQEGATFFFHVNFAWGDNWRGGAQIIQLYDSAGNPWLALTRDGFLQYNSGTTGSPVWTNLNTTAFVVPAYKSPVPIDVIVKLSNTGTHVATLAYSNVAVIGPINVPQALWTNIAQVQVHGDGNGSQDTWSAFGCTENMSTISAKVLDPRPDGVGAHSDWAGTYTDVNEPVADDSTVNQATTAGLIQSYPVGNITVPTGYIVAGAMQFLRVKNDGAAPLNIKSLCRPGSTDHISADLAAPGPTFAGAGAMYPVNPDTGVAWAQADWNAPVQFGFESAT